SRSERMVGAMPGREARKSWKRCAPRSRSRTRRSVHRSPTTSNAFATGQACSYLLAIAPFSHLRAALITRGARVCDAPSGVPGLLSWPDFGTRVWRAAPHGHQAMGTFFHIEY